MSQVSLPAPGSRGAKEMTDKAVRANALIRQLLDLVEEETLSARSDEQIDKRKQLLRAQENLEDAQRNLFKALRDE